MLRLTRRAAVIGLLAATSLAAKRLPQLGPAPMRRTFTASKRRSVDIWLWPAKGRRRGRIHFSHGNFSAPVKYARLLDAWAADGWDVFAPLHVDSIDHPNVKSYSPQDSWPTRIEDMALLSDDAGQTSYVAAGHSYGGLIALVLGGAKPGLPIGTRDPKANAVIALSPPGQLPSLIDRAGFAALEVPALIQTGDKDVFPGQPPEAWRNHLTAFEAPKPRDSLFAVTLAGADHYLGGIYGRPELPGPKAEAGFADLLTVASHFLARYGAGRAKAGLALDRLVKARKLMRR